MLNWQMEASKSIEKKCAVNCGQCVLEKKKIHNDISSHFKFVFSNERLDKKKIKRINNAD